MCTPKNGNIAKQRQIKQLITSDDGQNKQLPCGAIYSP